MLAPAGGLGLALLGCRSLSHCYGGKNSGYMPEIGATVYGTKRAFTRAFEGVWRIIDKYN